MIKKYGVRCDLCGKRAYIPFKRLPKDTGYLVVCKKCDKDMRRIV